jgi:hypothetical protein
MGLLADTSCFYIMFAEVTALPLLGLGSLHWLGARRQSHPDAVA